MAVARLARKGSPKLEKVAPMWKITAGAAVPSASIATPVLDEREIQVRNLRFEFDRQRVGSWHPQGTHVALWFDVWSLFFPAGESFFIESVRRFEAQIRSPVLRVQVQRFIGQEAMHGREHHRYNVLLQEAGLPARYLAKRIQNLLAWIAKRTPAKIQLAMTVGLEHITAMMADAFLSDARLLEGCDPRYAALWWWHAIEETEHKAVAFEVYQEVSAADWFGYARRVCVMLGISLAFAFGALAFHFILVARAGHVGDRRGWGKLLGFLFAVPGLLRGQLRRYLDYFRWDFHPWQYDNYYKIAHWKSVKLPSDAAGAATLPQGVDKQVVVS